MRRALLLEPVGFDFDDCLPWGNLETLFPAGVPCAAHDPEFVDLLLDRLQAIRYDTRSDALIIAGKLAKVVRACAIMRSMSPGLKTLYWDNARNRQRYVLRED